MPLITPIYAAVLTLFFIFLSVRVTKARTASGVSLGIEGDPTLLKRVRVHANFAEYIPLALLLMFFLEIQGVSDIILHLCGVGLIIGRLLHVYAIDRDSQKLSFRIAGASITFIIMSVMSLMLLYLYFAP